MSENACLFWTDS